MKNVVACFLGIALLSFYSSGAQDLGLDISYAQYQNDQDQTYVELYFALNGNTLSYKSAGKAYEGGVEVTVLFKQDSSIEAADRFRILANVEDTASVNDIFIQQERFALVPGNYQLQLELKDIHDSSEHYSISQNIEVHNMGQSNSISDILLLDSYKPADEKNQYAKSGYELIPMVSSGSYYFPDAMTKLSFYVELYNLPPNEPYLLKYYIENSAQEKPLNEYAAFSKKQASEVQPVLAEFDISKLPTGNYNLVVEAVNKNNETLLQKKQFFFRRNEEAKPNYLTDLSETDITGTFVDRIDNFDSIYTYVQYLYPISSEREQDFQKSLLASRDKPKMKRYFYSYWEKIDPYNPEGAWKKYHKEVRITNDLFGTRIQKGYLTSRGRVYLVYGRPDMVEDRKFEPTMPPYQIWQYNQINSEFAINQTNRFFVFAEYELSTNDYEMVHSTALGELYDSRWKYTMARRGNGGTGPDVDSRSDELSQDSYGSRLNNNMIFKSGGSGTNR